MNEEVAAILAAVVLLIIFGGEPDLHDAMLGKVACGNPSATLTLKGEGQ